MKKTDFLTKLEELFEDCSLVEMKYKKQKNEDLNDEEILTLEAYDIEEFGVLLIKGLDNCDSIELRKLY